MKFPRLFFALLATLSASMANAVCPWNTSLNSTLNFCADSNNAYGPFTRSMTAACLSDGFTGVCTNTVNVFYNGTNLTGIAVPVQRWSKSYAQGVRGTGSCPRGSARSSNFDNLCVETTSQFGTEVYGQFAQAWVEMCRTPAINGGNACFLNRWSSGVYTSVRDRINGTANWKLPMPGGFTTSDWCVCRNIGTSPHIGWDLVNDGNMTSVAIESGKISSGPTLNGGCGWEVELTDRFGTIWKYRHLNQPNLSNGQAITAGATIGLHRDFPSSSCGSGAHLHFERLSAGFFRDSSTSKNCTGVAASCNFDPRKAFPNFRTAVAGTLAVIDETKPTESAAVDAQNFPRNTVCRLDPASYPVVADSDLTGLAPLPNGLTVDFQHTAKTDSTADVAELLAFTAGYSDNAGNVCKRGNCITSVTLYAELIGGGWARVMSDASVRNQQVTLTAESAFCAPQNGTGKYAIKLTDLAGLRYRADF